MKRALQLIAMIVVMVISFSYSTKAEDRDHILKIYNWADYIDESVLDEFKSWYKEQTGEEIEIIYQLFDINEIMLAKIEKGHEDYDVVCPSDYIIERMLRQDLLLPIDKDFGSTPNYISNLSPYIVKMFSLIDGSGKNANDYAVGYMWGTTGILYNKKEVAKEDAMTWNILYNEKYSGRLLVKDAFRDVYGPILIYLRQDDILSGKVTMDKLMYDSSDESIAAVEKYIKGAKKNIAGWEADFGKEMMTKGDIVVNLTWSGDAVWAINEAREVGVELGYEVPKEGSNVWFDGWVIPKYARNVRAARYFINFLCRSDIAIKNMDEIGYVSAIGTEEVLANRIDESNNATPIDVSYFFGENAKSVAIDPVQYPSIDIVSRCTMMHDSGERTDKMLEMWARIKGDNMSTWTLVVLGLIGAATVYTIVSKVLSSRRKKLHRKKSRK